MWFLIMRSPSGAPREYALKTGRTTIGRKSDNDIVISDESASRVHTELVVDAAANQVIVRDLGSMNGTFVNRERLARATPLLPTDQLRIGQHVASVQLRDSQTAKRGTDQLPGTSPLTRETLLEAIDQHAILLFEVAHRLNTIIDLDTALSEVSKLMQTAMGADKCDIILAEKFDRLAEMGFPTSFARQAIEQRSAVVVTEQDGRAVGDATGQSSLLLKVRSALCVPVMSGEEVIALIYVYKTNPEARPFDPRDLQLAMGISNQAAMTIQRTNLLKKVRQGDRIRNLFHRFLSSAEADFVLQEYLRTNELPGLTEQILTVVFVDMRDSVALAERLGARRFGDILTLYYHEMAKAVFDNNGLLNKFMGDGLMAVFGALGKPEPERHAVQAALSMLSRMENINRAEDQHIEIGLGVNSGVVAAGYVGSEERVEYTVLGDAVNVAQRLQAQARNQVFVGQETLEVVGQFFHSRPVGPVEIRGRTQPVEVFEILRSTAPLPNLVRA